MYTVCHFDIVLLLFRNQETVQDFSNTFYTKTTLSQGLLPIMELFKKRFLQY